jgi:hypothetical protein
MGAILAMVGCHGDNSQAPAAPAPVAHRAPAPAKKGPTPEEQTAGMVEAAVPGKSVVPVSLKFELAQRPVVGRTVTLALAVLPQIPADTATIQWVESPSLKVEAAAADLSFANVQPTEVYRREIKVTPAADGVFFLSLNVSLKHDEIVESKAFTVPIIVLSEKEFAANGKH